MMSTISKYSSASIALTLILVLLFSGCLAAAPSSTQTSAAEPVDPKADNAQMLNQLIPGLLVTIEISGSSVALLDSQVVMAPPTSEQPTANQSAAPMIILTGLRDGAAVADVAVADQSINIQEGAGLVTLESRTVVAVLPLPEAIDALDVQVPGDPTHDIPPQTESFDVSAQMREFCQAFPTMSLCQ